ncbi:MAG TPA: hypothetical protein ENJ93_10350 [Chloroflexi bacterium]|nr:hypothetical protein [Chloroflexota bacterium]
MTTITIELSEPLFEKLQRAARLTKQPVEMLVEQSLAVSLPPLLEDVPAEYQKDVFPLLKMDVADLQQEVQRVFPPERWRRYETLLEKKRETGLTEAERDELVALRREADVLTLRKGYAAVLLKRRGYHVPAPEQLPLAQ